MVRIKHRYLLLHILHPNPTTSTPNKTTNSSKEQEPPIPWGPLTFHRPTPDKLLTPPLLLKLIKDSLSTLFGELASGQISSSLQIKYCSAATSTAIVRVARGNYRMVWAALSFVTRLSPLSPLPPSSVMKPPGGMMEEEGVVVVRVVRVSGTVKKCEEEAVRRAREVARRVEREERRRRKGLLVGNAEMEVEEDDDDGMEGLSMIGGIEDRDEEDADDDED